MDKAQKELIKTYYRKRNISAKNAINAPMNTRSSKNSFKSYETNEYVLANKIMNVDSFSSFRVFVIVKDKPDLIRFFIDKLDTFSKNNVVDLIIRNPQQVEYFQNRFPEFNDEDIADVIIDQPQLIDYFKDRIGEITDKDDITKITKLHPHLIQYFNTQHNG